MKITESIYCMFGYIFSTPSSTAIFFSILISSILSVLIFLATGWRERVKARKALKLEKMDALYSKIYEYSRTAKKYLWSIKREDQAIVRNWQLAEKARELLYECEVYKNLYFKKLPLDPSCQHSEMERISGECDKIWMKVPKGKDVNVELRLDACKQAGNEIKNLDNLLKPITDWCLQEASNYQ